MKELNVLSLFNGMGCIWIAMEMAGHKINKRYSSEIEKFPNQANDSIFPDTEQLGDVRNVDVLKLESIDFLGGGSPCQSFSFAGKRKGMSAKEKTIFIPPTENEYYLYLKESLFEPDYEDYVEECRVKFEIENSDKELIEILTLQHYLQLKEEGFEFEGQSYLFWEYIRILTDIRKYNPDVKFLLENVIMGSKWQKVITQAIGINPIRINAALVSAQNRDRLFWTNIYTEQDGFFGDLKCMIPQPKDEGILLKDILETEVDEKYFLSGKSIDYLQKRSEVNKLEKRGFGAVFPSPEEKSSCIDTRYGALRNSGETYIVHNTMPRSSTTGKGGTGPLSRSDGNTNAIEIQCVAMRGRNPDNPKSRKSGLPTEQKLEPRTDGKTNCLTSVKKDNLVQSNKTIRRLTPRECERLQCVPDDYTKFGSEIKTLIGWKKNVVLNNAIQMSSLKKLNSATSITYDLLDMEQQNLQENLLQKEKNVKWNHVIDNNQHLTAYVLCTLKELKELEVYNFPKELIPQIKSVNIVITKLENSDQKECAQNIIKCKDYIQIHYMLNRKDKNHLLTDTLGILVELECTESLWLNTLEEALKDMKKCIILTWLEQITKSLIFTYANQCKSIELSMQNLIVSEKMELISEILYLKTENISILSDSARYKMLGNGWNCKVIAWILSFLDK